MKAPPCPIHRVFPSICVSRGLDESLRSGVAFGCRVRPIYLAYIERGARFAVAYLTDDDYAKAEDRSARRVVRAAPYAPDGAFEAVLRELLAGDTPVLIDRADRHEERHDFALIEQSQRRMRLVCAACLEEALAAAGLPVLRTPKVPGIDPLPLDDPMWRTLGHAYGSAADIPDMLRALAAAPGPRGDWQAEPWYMLWSSLCHQGDAYTASYAAVPHIVRLARETATPVDFSFFQLPAAIEVARRTGHAPEIPAELAPAYHRALADLMDAVNCHRDEPWDEACSCRPPQRRPSPKAISRSPRPS